MKFIILSLALLNYVAADVSHLNNKYLPPVLDNLADKQHVSYVEQTQEIPQASVQEVFENSVVENTQIADSNSGQEDVSKLNDFVEHEVHNADVVDQHIQNTADIYHQVQVYAQQQAEETTVSSSKLQYSSQYQQQEPAAYNNQISQQQNEFVSQVETLQQYQANEYVKPEQILYSAAPVEHHHAENELNQQQQQQQPVVYNVQQSIATDFTVPAGIDTQYASNGGYVY